MSKTTCTDCASQSGAELYINFDHTTGDYEACTSGDSTGTASGAAAATTQNHTESACTASPLSSLYKTDTGQYVQFDITSKDIFDSAHGYVDLWVYVGASAVNDTIFEAYFGDNDRFIIRLYGDTNHAYASHKNNEVNIEVQSANSSIDDSGWNHILVKFGDGADYDGSGAELAINVNGDGWVYTATKNTLAAFATEPPDIEIGCATMCYAAAETDDVWIDDVKSYTTADGS